MEVSRLFHFPDILGIFLIGNGLMGIHDTGFGAFHRWE
jgi:hypothetical protein